MQDKDFKMQVQYKEIEGLTHLREWKIKTLIIYQFELESVDESEYIKFKSIVVRTNCSDYK